MDMSILLSGAQREIFVAFRIEGSSTSIDVEKIAKVLALDNKGYRAASSITNAWRRASSKASGSQKAAPQAFENGIAGASPRTWTNSRAPQILPPQQQHGQLAVASRDALAPTLGRLPSALLAPPSGAHSKSSSSGPSEQVKRALMAAAATNTGDASNTAALLAGWDPGIAAEEDPIPPPPPPPEPVSQAAVAIAPSVLPRPVLPSEPRASGLDTLRNMVETAKEPAGEAATRPQAGYAMSSMMSRAADNARASMRSSLAATAAPGKDGRGASQAAPGGPGSGGAVAAGSSEADARIFIGNIPQGTSEGLILVECAKHGTVASIKYQADTGDLLEGGSALVTFTDRESAGTAVQRLGRRIGLFGASRRLEVRVGTSEDADRLEKLRSERQLLVEASVSRNSIAEATERQGAPPAQSAALSQSQAKSPQRRKGRSRTRSRNRSARRSSRSRRRRRSEEKKKKNKKRKRSTSSSDSGRSSGKRSGSAEDKQVGAVVSSTAFAEKVGRSSGGFGFDAAPGSTLAIPGAVGSARPASFPEVPAGGRQVSARGNWAEFAIGDGRNYYANIATGEKTWTRPANCDSTISRRKEVTGPQPAQTKLFVGSLPPGITDHAFWQLVQAFGNIVDIKCVPDSRYGFVRYSTVVEADAALAALNGFTVNGVKLAVRFAKSP